MTYHILAYCCEDAYRGNEYLLHIITQRFRGHEHYLALANQLVRKHAKEPLDMRYVGVEELPIDAGEGHVLFTGKVLEPVEEAGRIDLAALAEHKRRWLKVDFDATVTTTAFDFVSNCLSELRRLPVERFDFYRTPGGAHLRAALSEPVEFGERLKLRDRLGDDAERQMYDKMLAGAGYEGLADMLFNSKYYRPYGGGGYRLYREEPLAFSEIPIGIELPRIELLELTVEGRAVRFKEPVDAVRAVRIARSIEDNFWEYSVKAGEDLAARVARAYGEVSPFLAAIVMNCDVRAEGGRVVIHVPETYQRFVGRLIGKKGANVREVETRVGCRIKIVQEGAPEDETGELKRRMRELLSSLVE